MQSRILLGAGLAALASVPAHGEENPFGYSYTADTEEKGETELSLWATDRRGKDAGHYDAQDYRVEVERGITNRFQIAGYLNFASHHVHGLEPDFERVDRNFAFQGASVEFKYRVLDQSKHGIALALYAEPGWSRIHSVEGGKGTEYELELKAIASKEFAGGRMVWAGNLTFEPEWERERRDLGGGLTERRWGKELKIEATTGLAWRLSRNWYLGAEARYSSVYPEWTHGFHREAYDVSAGPTISFKAEEFSASLTYLPQLFGAPSGDDRRTFGQFEKRQIRLKVSKEF